MKFFFIHILFCFSAIFLCNSPLIADDEVLKTIDEAVSQYSKGEYDAAASNLDYAAQLVRQKKSDALKAVFPEPLAGWESGPADSQATGTAAFGRSINVSRVYSKTPATVTIEIVSDSPVMQSLVMMLNNPVLAGAGGAKLEAFSDHKGIVQYSEENKGGDINILVDEKYMVTVKGQQVSREDLLAYAQAVKFAELAKK